ncbi:MAG: DNA polymerase III subunit beta [Planctomycetes bacterium]|nr:DNA polymerase III subunit beta [Planctomycetota bacterium]
MKLQCHRSSLMTAFQIVGGVVPARTPKEILKNVKLSVDENTATLIGTDQEVGIRYEIPGVEIESPGETLLPTNRVISILRELQENSVLLEVTEKGVRIRSGQSDFILAVEEAVEFPSVAAFEDQAYYVVSGPSLREAIRRTVFAADEESTRYALGGVQLELSNEGMVLAATDSRRLALVKSTCRVEGEIETAAGPLPVVPKKAMVLLERSIDDEESDVFLAVHENGVVVKSGRSTISSQLVQGRFPKYQDVIPKDPTTSVNLVVGMFLSAVRQAQIVTNDESRGVDFTFADGLLKLESQAADIGNSTIELPIDYNDKELKITFDPRYIAEFLRVLEPEKSVQLDLIDSESAAVFRTDDAYTYVIMPLSRDR